MHPALSATISANPNIIHNPLACIIFRTSIRFCQVAVKTTNPPGRFQPDDETGADDPLEGGEWVLVGYGPERALIELPAGVLVTISFADDGLRGSAGCNSYFGGYQVSGDAIEVGPVGSTEMWCEGALDDRIGHRRAGL
jgi:hypothetical protein